MIVHQISIVFTFCLCFEKVYKHFLKFINCWWWVQTRTRRNNGCQTMSVFLLRLLATEKYFQNFYYLVKPKVLRAQKSLWIQLLVLTRKRQKKKPGNIDVWNAIRSFRSHHCAQLILSLLPVLYLMYLLQFCF